MGMQPWCKTVRRSVFACNRNVSSRGCAVAQCTWQASSIEVFAFAAAWVCLARKCDSCHTTPGKQVASMVFAFAVAWVLPGSLV